MGGSDPMGLQTAYGAAGAGDALQRLRAAVVQRLQQQFQNDLALRSADRADRELQMQDELKRAQLSSLQQQRDATIQAGREKQAEGVATSLGEPSIGQPLQPSTANLLRAGNLGEAVQHQSATLPSTQDQGGVAMPQLRGRMIAPSGAVGPEQGTASSGAATSIAQPGNPEQDVYRGTGPQRHQAEQTQMLRGMLRMLPPDSPLRTALSYEEATGRNLPAGVLRPSLDQIGQEAEARAKASAKYRQAPTVVIQTTDASGNPVSKIVPKTAGSEFAAKPTTQALDAARTNREAQDTLNQLDQSIEQARSLIGPGRGQLTSIEQMIGSGDPRAQALGVKMKAAKMRFDHAVTGSVRAGASPVLLAQWDNILANKVTPEGLKAGVQAMREILGGQSTTGAGDGGTVRMKAPNGQISDVPANQVEHFKAKGAVVVP